MKALSLKRDSFLAEVNKLLKLKEEDLEKALAQYNYYDLMELILSCPWEERARLILLSPYSEAIVKNMPCQELFLTLKASSLDVAVELLSYARGSQIQFFFDIDAWYKDRIKPERVASWITLLFEAGENKVLEWLQVADWDFLIAVLQKFIKVYKRPDDIDLTEALDFLPPYTLDDFYFIEFKVEALEFYFRRIIEIIREMLPEQYMALMESLIWEIPAEVEERAFRWRNGRLADEGILEYFEALEVYSPLHPKRLRKVELAYFKEDEQKEVNINLLLPAKLEEDLLIYRVLSQIEDAVQLNRIKRELAWLANKLIIVDNVVIDEIEQIYKTLKKVWGGLNLGLEYIAEEDEKNAKKAIETYFLEDIFRAGQTLLRDLRKLAFELTKNCDASVFKYLDQPYQNYLQGVLVKNLNEIKLFNPQKIGTLEEYTFFKKVNEVRLVRRYVEEAGYMAPLIQKIFGSPLSWLIEINKKGRNFDAKFYFDAKFLTWSNLILTAIAYWSLFKEFKFKAIPKSKWKEVLDFFFEVEKEGVRLKKEIKEKLLDNFYKFAKMEWYLDETLLKSFLDFVLDKLEKEFKYIDFDNLPDPKFQTLFLVDLTQ